MRGKLIYGNILMELSWKKKTLTITSALTTTIWSSCPLPILATWQQLTACMLGHWWMCHLVGVLVMRWLPALQNIIRTTATPGLAVDPAGITHDAVQWMQLLLVMVSQPCRYSPAPVSVVATRALHHQQTTSWSYTTWDSSAVHCLCVVWSLKLCQLLIPSTWIYIIWVW